MKLYFLFALDLFVNLHSIAQSITGEWITIDVETGVEKSVVKIYEKDGKYYGKIVEFLQEGADEDAACTHCKGDMKGKKLMGFDVLKAFEKEGNEFVNGTVTDPENDKTYDAKMWVDNENPNILNLRAYVSLFYKTIQWKRP